VRILTYGYDSHLGSFKSAANTSGIADHGQNLLNSLEVIRRKDPKRRLIFIAHSLGGLIVKEVGTPQRTTAERLTLIDFTPLSRRGGSMEGDLSVNLRTYIFRNTPSR
jgi:hypothetical protein